MKRKSFILTSHFFLIVLFAVIVGEERETQKAKEGGVMKLTSKAFQHEGMIPSVYTCDGEDISPPLEWTDVPSNVKSFALICDDPDAPMGTWVHWVIYNIPADSRSLEEKVPTLEVLKNETCQGINDFRKVGYGGPCPPSGVHRYFFKLYALDTTLKPEKGVTKDKLLKMMKGHILAEAQLMGKYSRKK
ncbi:MAG: YbhB/YbcL family Raf kinase inhibitor-like protein [Chitinispirillaceae bacterium]|nr:YbhB/YbcL family Raf kinase inhibitor-like protein [Chitinispirillaceae bacterium]